MTTANAIQPPEGLFPTDEVQTLAKEGAQKLARLSLPTGSKPGFRLVQEGSETEIIELPAVAVHFLMEILRQMALGNAVTVLPIHAELTTQKAADLLNVSRPFLVKLIENGKIPHRKVGTHRRVLAKDVLAFQAENEAARKKTLDELASYDQELGLE